MSLYNTGSFETKLSAFTIFPDKNYGMLYSQGGSTKLVVMF